MKGQGLSLVAVAFGALLIGALLLKGLAKDGPSDPTASADNGAPQGLLALALFLEGRGVVVERERGFGAALPAGRALLVVPPPEGSAWTDAEVAGVLPRVEAGDVDVLLLCDEDELRVRRLSAWERALGARCTPGEGTPTAARGTLPGYAADLFVRGGGRVASAEERIGVPAWLDEDGRVVVLRQRVGEGAVTWLGSASVLANDGLAEADNAALLPSLLPTGARVVFDEAHHTFRSAEVLDQAFSGIGPRVALFALLLLVPFVLLGFVPRRGDPPPAAPEGAFLAARASADALAGLYLRAGVELSDLASRGGADAAHAHSLRAKEPAHDR